MATLKAVSRDQGCHSRVFGARVVGRGVILAAPPPGRPPRFVVGLRRPAATIPCSGRGSPCSDLGCQVCLFRTFGQAESAEVSEREACPPPAPTLSRRRSRSPWEQGLRDIAEEEHNIEVNLG